MTGASSGIGAAPARLLSRRGFRVFGTSRRPAELGDDAPDVEWVAMDVCDDDSVRKGVDRVLQAAGSLDGLVRNAGFGIFGSVEEVSLVDDIDTPFDDRMSWGGSSDSPYAERIRSCEDVIRESLPKAPPPEVVAQAILRALGDHRPRVRYAVGAESLLVPMARRLLPDRLSLRFIRSHFRI